jgi:hypothetical protein
VNPAVHEICLRVHGASSRPLDSEWLVCWIPTPFEALVQVGFDEDEMGLGRWSPPDLALPDLAASLLAGCGRPVA